VLYESEKRTERINRNGFQSPTEWISPRGTKTTLKQKMEVYQRPAHLIPVRPEIQSAKYTKKLNGPPKPDVPLARGEKRRDCSKAVLFKRREFARGFQWIPTPQLAVVNVVQVLFTAHIKRK
jgi:hypothetical protein